jgi:hypothetical protein
MTHKTRTVKTNLFFLNLLFVFLLFAVFLHAGPADAYTKGRASFQWKANPAQETVAGYRLYYGTKSRFDAAGKPKSNFAYDYYIDLAESVRCNNLSYSNDCEYLAPNELSCKGLDSGSPSCSLANLQGTLHFAMTAFNASKESGYTKEFKIAPTGQQPQPQKKSLLPAIQLLLR